MRHDDVIDELLAMDRVILAREHPRLQSSLVRAANAGRLARPLPGVYADAGSADSVLTRAAAVCRYDPSAVITGRAAAALSYWPEVDVPLVAAASPYRRTSRAGIGFSRRRVAPDLVQRRGPLAFTVPSLTALELATLDDTDPIDLALRRRVADLASLRDALRQTPGRRGNAERWQVLLDSRAEPWSRAERLTHRLYREAGISGWVANAKIAIPQWATYYLDIAFEAARLACEIDGRETHDNSVAFESDRERQNALVLAGWTVLRFTWRMITEDPAYVLWATRTALAVAAGKAPLASRTWRDTPWTVA